MFEIKMHVIGSNLQPTHFEITILKVTIQKYIEINWLHDVNIIQCTT